MVRKWSYLNKSSNLQIQNTLEHLTLSYTFKVFRVTTRFKKFQRYETKFVRKQDSARKRQTSWLTLTTILAYWSLSYLKVKYFLRFYQTIGLYFSQFTIPNKLVLDKKFNLLSNNLVYNTSNISQKLLQLFQVNFNKNIFFTNLTTPILKETNVSQLTCSNDHYEIILPKQMLFQTITYKFQIQLFNNTLNMYISFYKILIFLTLWNIQTLK